MRTFVALLASTLFATLSAGSVLAFPNQKETFSHRPELGVVVLSSTGEKIPVASLELCRSDADVDKEPCRNGISDPNGEFVFTQVTPGKYRLTVQLDGYVPAGVGPMSVNAEGPIAPDRVVVVLNAACYDC